MLSTALPTIVIALLCLVVGFLGIQVENQRRRTKAAIRYIENQNKRSLSLRKIADLETTLTELLDSYEALLSSHKKLRSRIGMREHREKKKAQNLDQSDDSLGPVPTDEVEKARYKRELRAQMKARGLI